LDSRFGSVRRLLALCRIGGIVMVDSKLALLWLGDFSLILTFSRWEKGCNPSPLVYAVPLLEIVRAYVRSRARQK
jgi:hypothetical protein